tara:strand:+ start:135 stop:1508 length:1374 start_codon:yes stop_codon:yes gene_type:complete
MSDKRVSCLSAVLLGIGSVLAAISFASADEHSSALLPAPVTEDMFLPFDPDRALLGRMLFYDPVISGNRNISCATCHNPEAAGSDGLPLGIGEGGSGIGAKRTVGTGRNLIRRRVPRNSPALFNLGATQFTALFYDGRLEADSNDPSGFDTPADEDTPLGLNSILAAQALFPLTSQTEMAGQATENDIGRALEDIYGNPWNSVWAKVEDRLRSTDAYLPLFQAAYPDIKTARDISIVHYANAVGDFINAEWRSFQSPFDRFLAGQTSALSAQQQQGLELFYGAANCAACHGGPFLTDQQFYAIAMPQIGPGKVPRLQALRYDRGRAGATNRIEDRYKFRTPSLRNVALTAPYGHSGAFATLDAIVRHHLDPTTSFNQYSLGLITLPAHPKLSREDGFIMQDRRERRRILKANVLKPIRLDEAQIGALVAFLESLTDPASVAGRLGIPQAVPSGLPVE